MIAGVMLLMKWEGMGSRVQVEGLVLGTSPGCYSNKQHIVYLGTDAGGLVSVLVGVCLC